MSSTLQNESCAVASATRRVPKIEFKFCFFLENRSLVGKKNSKFGYETIYQHTHSPEGMSSFMEIGTAEVSKRCMVFLTEKNIRKKQLVFGPFLRGPQSYLAENFTGSLFYHPIPLPNFI